jgi:hypothetical protein
MLANEVPYHGNAWKRESDEDCGETIGSQHFLVPYRECEYRREVRDEHDMEVLQQVVAVIE